MPMKLSLILIALSAVLSAAVTRYYFPKVDTRTLEVEKEVVRTDVRTITRVVERPDGTRETVTDTTDKTIKDETSKKEVTIAAKSNYIIDVAARTKITDFGLVYDLQIQKRIMGPIFVGVKGSTDQSVGVSVGLEF